MHVLLTVTRTPFIIPFGGEEGHANGDTAVNENEQDCPCTF